MPRYISRPPMIFNKIVLFTCLRELNHDLKQPVFSLPNYTKTLSFKCGEKIAFGISHPQNSDRTLIRMWYTNTYFGIWHDDFDSGKFLAALDYSVCDDHIKIDYMNLYDQEYVRYQTHYRETEHLNTQRAAELNHAMLDYIANQARTMKKPKVIVDVHQNLRIFDNYYKPYGFFATERRCRDNPYWVEAELAVEPQKSPDTI